MATEYFITAGDRIIEQIDICSSDYTFNGLMRKLKATLSVDAQTAFNVMCEYEFYPEEGEREVQPPYSDSVFNEIEAAWLVYIKQSTKQG